MPVTSETELAVLLSGFAEPQKRVSSKYFYDHRGSRLFEEITRLREYYPTRRERVILEANVPEWVARYRPRSLVELGAGSAEKTRIILDGMGARTPGTGLTYVPMDVSEDFLRDTARGLQEEYPGLYVHPVVGDMARPFGLDVTPEGPAWFALLGGTIGNFRNPDATQLLGRMRALMTARDLLFLGVDLRPSTAKSVERLELAYNDRQGVTAKFNLNLLCVLNERFDGTFDVSAFEHAAHYDRELHRIEMHLVSRYDQVVQLAGEKISFAAGETLRSEISCKYDRPAVTSLFAGSGLELESWVPDPGGYYAVALGKRIA